MAKLAVQMYEEPPPSQKKVKPAVQDGGADSNCLPRPGVTGRSTISITGALHKHTLALTTYLASVRYFFTRHQSE